MKRPFGMYFLIIGFLLLTWFGWLRVQQAIIYRQFLESFNMSVGIPYIISSGAVMGLAGAITAIGLWWRKCWAGILSALTAVIFACWYWIDKLFISVSSTTHSSRPFKIIITAVGLITVFILLYRAYHRGYFFNETTRDRS